MKIVSENQFSGKTYFYTIASSSHSFPNFGLLEKHCVEVHGAGETMRCHFGCETLFKRRQTSSF